MRAKLVKENIDSLFKPKSEDELETIFDKLSSEQHKFNKAVQIGYLSKVKELINNEDVDPYYNNYYLFTFSLKKEYDDIFKVLLDYEKKYQKMTLYDIDFLITRAHFLKSFNIKKILQEYKNYRQYGR